MKIIVAEPNRKAYEKEIKGELDDSQKIVEGYIEPVPFSLNGQSYIVFCNEEGLIQNLSPNRYISGNLIHGNFVVARYDGGTDIKGLTDKEIKVVLSELNKSY